MTNMCSVSNIAWPIELSDVIVPKLADAGITGIEIAPTLLWPNPTDIEQSDVVSVRESFLACGLAISGTQSLLYGIQDLHLLDKKTWPLLLEHMNSMVRVTADLGANIAVFGSPRNRLRGEIPCNEAQSLAAEFFGQLIPTLTAYGVTLTLEPNAPEYGADFLTTYAEVIDLCKLIDSNSVRAQIDTGCLNMVGVDSVEAIGLGVPAHVHISAPWLGPIEDFEEAARLANLLVDEHQYKGWFVLETLPEKNTSAEAILDTARQFVVSLGNSLE